VFHEKCVLKRGRLGKKKSNFEGCGAGRSSFRNERKNSDRGKLDWYTKEVRLKAERKSSQDGGSYRNGLPTIMDSFYGGGGLPSSPLLERSEGLTPRLETTFSCLEGMKRSHARAPRAPEKRWVQKGRL